MKVIQYIVLWLLGGHLLSAAEIRFRLPNAPERGSVIAMVFDSANAFGDFRDPMRSEQFDLADGPEFLIKDLPAGEFALVAYFDENENGRLDENFMGIPVERVGFSNAYWPKGPPTFVKARFLPEAAAFDVDLRRPLGERGQVAFGVGVIGRSSPYRDYDGDVYQFIPALTYIGDRFQVLGPNVQAGLLRRESLNLALKASYAIGVYEEDDSPVLRGMGDREDTLMAGLALENDFPGGVEVQLSYEHDVLDRIGGGMASLRIDKSFQAGIFRFSPQLGLNWLSSDLGDHFYGVPLDRVNEQRSAYEVDDSFSWELGMGSFIELSPSIRVILNVSSEFLDNEITDSPIVDNDYVLKGFSALSYAF